MFENLQDKLQGVFQRLSNRGKLSEADVDAALREVRLALLEADVNFKVVKDFVNRVRERAIGSEVMRSLTPAQQVVKIVNEELIATLGQAERLKLEGATPHVIMLVGLQGSGKTTTAAKLASSLKKSYHTPLMVAADTRRPAAMEQLRVLGRQLDVPVFALDASVPPPRICAEAIKAARKGANDIVILDTAGRLHIDETLMAELTEVKKATNPGEVLLVADAMTGQDAVRVAESFHQQVGLSGLILTKVDGDARGGAAISIRSVTGVPIKYLGIGEKTSDLEPFHPDRLASRILGMGDMLTLIERAQSSLDQHAAQKAGERLLAGEFNLDDFLSQIRELKKMGPLSQLLDMVPGMNKLSQGLTPDVTDRQMRRTEAIISSMTAGERRNPKLLNGSRKRRVAAGSGTSVQEVNQLLVQFRQMQRMMKQLSGNKRQRGLANLLGGFKF